MYKRGENTYSFIKNLEILKEQYPTTYEVVIAVQEICAAMPKDFPFAVSAGLGSASWVTDEGWIYRDLREIEVYVQKDHFSDFLGRLPYPYKLEKYDLGEYKEQYLYSLNTTPKGLWSWFKGRKLVKMLVILYHQEDKVAKMKGKKDSRELSVWRKIMGRPIKVMPLDFLKRKASWLAMYNMSYCKDYCVMTGDPHLYEYPPWSGRKSIITFTLEEEE